MTDEAAQLQTACLQASNTPAAKMSGVSGALKLLASWLTTVEQRLEKLERESYGNRS